MSPAHVTRAHKWLNMDDDTAGIYNAWDTYATAACIKPLIAELTDNGQLDFYTTWFRRLGPAVHGMYRRGAGRIDRAAKTQYRKAIRREIGATESVVRARMGDPSVYTDKFFGSPKQKAQFLYDELGFKAPPKTRTRPERSTDQSALMWILQHMRRSDEQHISALHALFHRSRLNTIDTRYLEIEEDDDGRVRPTIKLYGAKTGRLAYADPALQQWPPEIRHTLRPAVGHVFLSADYAQLEARISAYLSRDPIDMEVFDTAWAEGDYRGDIHARNACALFGYDITKWASLVLNHTATRNFAKTWRFGVGYGGAPDSVQMKMYCPCTEWGCAEKLPPMLDLKRSEIALAARRWEREHSVYVEWREQLVRDVLRDAGRYESPWGYVRYFLQPMPGLRNEVYNNPMQHGAAQIINRAMVELHEQHQAPMVLQMHDELMLEVPERDVPHWTEVVTEVMQRPVDELGGASLPVNVSVGEDWGGVK